MKAPNDELTDVLLDIARPAHISSEYQRILAEAADYKAAQNWCTMEARRLEQRRAEQRRLEHEAWIAAQVHS